MKKFSGQIYNPDWGHEYQSGYIYCFATGLNFQGESGEVLLPYVRLQIDPNQGDPDQIYFHHPEKEGIWLVSDEKSILLEPGIQERPTLKRQIKDVNFSSLEEKRPNRTFGMLKWGGLAAGFILVLALIIQLALSGVVALISPSIEKSIGEASLNDYLENSAVANPKEEKWVQNILDKLVQSENSQEYQYTLTFIDEVDPNAFAFPGGYLVVTTGLIDFVDKDEEKIAGVLAHEMAHVIKRHGIKKLVNQAGPVLVIQAVLGSDAGVISLLANGSLFLSGMSYSRTMEYEADSEAVSILNKAGYSAAGLKGFLVQLKMLQGSEIPEFISTHPSNEERINKIEEKMIELDQ